MTLYNLAKDAMLAVQVRHCLEQNEELTAIGVRATIRHGDDTSGRVLVVKVLIIELVSIDRLTSCAVAICEVSALSHEAGDDSVELAAFK